MLQSESNGRVHSGVFPAPPKNVIANSGNDPSKSAGEVVQAIGYTPDHASVAALVAAHMRQGLLPDDIPAAVAIGKALAARETAKAYSILLSLRSRGVARDRILDLMSQLYGMNVDVEFRALAAGSRGAWSYTWLTGSDRKSIMGWLDRHDGLHNLYIGLNPRKPVMRGTDRASGQGDIETRRFIAFDHDNKDAPESDPEWKNAVALLQSAKPVMQVATGNGVHLWFAIEHVAAVAEIVAMGEPLNELLKAVGSDPVADSPRIMRLPWSINIPTKNKRERRAVLELAVVTHGPDPEARVWPWRDLVQEVTRLFSLDPSKLVSTSGRSTSSQAVVGGGNTLPDDRLRAPSRDLLLAALDLLPNGETVSRDYQVGVAHAVYGASKGTNFEEEARDAFLLWSNKYPFAQADTDEDLYDGIRTTKRGWPHIKVDLHDANRGGYEQILDREAPFRDEQARLAFEGAPLPDELKYLQDVPANCKDGCRTPIPSALQASSHKDETPDLDLDPKSTGRSSLAQKAMDELRLAGAKFFHSPNGLAWIELAGRIHQIDSVAGFRAVVSWLTGHTKHSLTGSARSDLKDLMTNRAFVGPKHQVHYRQAQGTDPKKPEAFVNMMDNHGNGIQVDGSGWRVVPTAAMPVRFTDRSGGLPLPVPVRAGDGINLFDRLGRHIPFHPVLKPGDPEDVGTAQRAALLMFLTNQIFRAGSAVHLSVHAPQGSGKTMAARRLKDLLDPDTAPVVPSLPSDEAMLFAIAEQQPLLALDNLSSMKGDAADLFCGLATGTFQQKRGLYTNGDRVIYGAKSSVIFGSIREDLIQRADLLDRTLEMDLPPLDPKDRKPEQLLNEAWQRDRAHILADLLDAISGGLARLDAVQASTPPDSLPRLADAALMAEAAAQGLGWTPGFFLAAINASRRGAADRQLEENPYAFRVRALLVKEGGSWTGKAAALMQLLRFEDGPDWGRSLGSAQSFTATMDRMAGPMRETWNIRMTRTRSHGARTITLARTNP